jgi:hypothetical protein
MRAIGRYLLAPLFIAAVFGSAGVSAHTGAVSTAHSRVQLADPICPAGTNWDDVLQACV